MDWKGKAKRLLGNRTRHIHGDGPFAFVMPCSDREFSLWATRADAGQAREESYPVEAIALA